MATPRPANGTAITKETKMTLGVWATITAIGCYGLVQLGGMAADIKTMSKDIAEIKQDGRSADLERRANTMELAKIEGRLTALEATVAEIKKGK